MFIIGAFNFQVRGGDRMVDNSIEADPGTVHVHKWRDDRRHVLTEFTRVL